MIREAIERAVQEALAELGASEATFVVERPGDMSHGDYATNAALLAAKALKKNPKELAEALAQKLEGKIDGVKKVEIAGPGFINFTLAGMKVKDIVHEAHEPEWGSNDLYKGKKIMVEYTDPNPFKEFHIGHLMSNAIGESIARMLERSGAQVIRANYQGDVGLHVAKAIWALQKKGGVAGNYVSSIGAAYVEGNTAYEENAEAKKEINEINKKIYERSDQQINTLYDAGRKISLEYFDEVYKILGTTFQKFFFESETTPIGTELVTNHPEVFEESDGARVFRGEQEGLHTRVFLTSQGLPTYEAKDLGLLKLKSAEDLNVSVTVTASEQKDYFKVVLAAARHLGEVKDVAAKTTHVTHGMMRFASGKMSSRKGNVITGMSLLNELTEDSKGKMQGRELKDGDKVAQQVAVAAIKYTVLKQGSGKDIVFDPVQSLSLEGDSGPYVQYALVRIRALLRNAASAKVIDPTPSGPTPIERLIVHFPEVVERAARELEPHYVTTYVTELAGAFNSWYASERMIVDGAITTRNLAVIEAIENTLARGLTVLGIPTPEEM
ncbi:MAG TPA: arginine--tRNA ligase [Candidatus Paceibacterota bacterium]|nr:arginine--tRNA ligase [Candidatus Paceibacterota bacterium]